MPATEVFLIRNKDLDKFDSRQLMVWINNNVGQHGLGFDIVTNNP